MRKLIKYTDHARWYTDERVGDSFKDGWKRWIKRKGSLNWRGKGLARKPNAKTVMFVPKTPNGGLMQQIQTVQDKLDYMGWRTKLVEKPGVPLYTRFVK